MELVVKAGAAFAVAAALMGTGPLAASGWRRAAWPYARLTAHAHALLHPGTPHPDAGEARI